MYIRICLLTVSVTCSALISLPSYSGQISHDGFKYIDCEKNFSWVKGKDIASGSYGSVKVACRKDNPQDCQYAAKVSYGDARETSFELETAILTRLNNSNISPNLYESFQCTKMDLLDPVETYVLIMDRFDETFEDVLKNEYLEQIKGRFGSLNDLIDYYEDNVQERLNNNQAKTEIKNYFEFFRKDPSKLNHDVIKSWINDIEYSQGFKLMGTSRNIIRYGTNKTHTRPLIKNDALNLSKDLENKLLQIGGLLQGLARHKIISRDMKPNNILHKKDGDKFAISDFGSAYMNGNEKSVNSFSPTFWTWNSYGVPKNIIEDSDYLFDALSLEVYMKKFHNLDYKFAFIDDETRDVVKSKFGLNEK